MPTIDLPQGTVHYHQAGPADSSAPPVVLIHGFLVNGSLWSATATALAAAGVRSYAPDLPLAAHPIALSPQADLTPRGVAELIVAFLERLDLRDATLVGNDTGGALVQFVLDVDPSRVGRVLLTNCDGFEQFPPAPFGLVLGPFRNPAIARALLAPMRSSALRHSPAGIGLMVRDPLDTEQTRGWVQPYLTDAGVRRDAARFVSAIDPSELTAVSGRLGAFPGPARIVWGAGDRFFKLALARRLRDAFADCTLVELPGAKTFVPLDEPDRLAAEIVALAQQPTAASRA